MITDIELALEVLNRYYILSDVNGEFDLAYNFENDKIYVLGDFTSDFVSSLDSKYNIERCDKGFIINDLESILYFYHEYRNYIFSRLYLPKIDSLSYMLDEFRKRIISKYKLNISNDVWMIEDSKNCFRYFEGRKEVSSKIKKLLNEFDSIVNPHSECINIENINEIKGYITDDGRKCIAVETKDDISIRRYFRRNEGFVYKFIKEEVNICHYFNGDGEGISALINDIKIRYNLSSGILQIDGKDVDMDSEYLVCEILMSAIKYYNVDLYEKVKMFK